jgi:hypothetical protein
MLTAAVAALSVAAPVQTAYAQAPTKQTFQALYDKQDAAVKKRDLNGAMAFVSPNVQIKMKNGMTVTFAQVKTQMQQIFASAKSISSSSKVQSVKMAAGNAVVRVANHGKFVIANPQTGKSMTLESEETSDDTWAKSKGHWQMVASSTVSGHSTMDGKPMPGGM